MKSIRIAYFLMALMALPIQANRLSNLFNCLSPKTDQQSEGFSRGEGYWSKPEDEKLDGFFGKLTDKKSQREDWYQVSPYVAEFWCTISNAGFIYVGLKHQSPEILCAGLASIASHTIPKQWLLSVDKIGVLAALSLAVREHEALGQNPQLIVPVLGLGAVNATDMYLARNYGKTWPHVVWHLSAALVADYVLSNIR